MISAVRESELLVEIEQLRRENDRLIALIGSPASPKSASAAATLSSAGSFLNLHYVYASPLVLLDSLGTTVIETFEPIRAESEMKRILQSLSASPRSVSPHISVASPANLARLRQSIGGSGLSSILHIAMHTVDVSAPSGRSVRCALEDEHGRGFLLTPHEFASSLGSLPGVSLVLVNACKSIEIATAILATCPWVLHVICLASSEPVLELTSQAFAAEFYAGVAGSISVRAAFDAAVAAVRTNPNPRLAAQADLFLLLPLMDKRHDASLFAAGFPRKLPQQSHPTKKLTAAANLLHDAPFWIGHVTSDLRMPPEDFVGRQIDIVRLCGVLFGGSGRRVCAVTGARGIGKHSFLGEAVKFLAAPGGRLLSGGICVVRLPRVSSRLECEDAFLRAVSEALAKTIDSVKRWSCQDSLGEAYNGGVDRTFDEFDTELAADADAGSGLKQQQPPSSTSSAVVSCAASDFESIIEDSSSLTSSPAAPRSRFDSVLSATAPDDGAPQLPSREAPSLKSYKVFWAETFSSAKDLAGFLTSYQLDLPDESSTLRLFRELRLNGTQLQDWGSGRLVRVVHVVRLLISAEDTNGATERFLLERTRDGSLRMLSKKFDPVTEALLDVAAGAVQKELGEELQGERIEITHLKLQDRRPVTEMNDTSPSYPGLATKYVLYTVNVSIAGLPGKDRFESTETSTGDDGKTTNKVHMWEWVTSGVPGAVKEVRFANHATNEHVADDHIRHKQYARLVHEWSALVGTGFSGLVLLHADEYVKNPTVRQLLGKALVLHPGLKILLSQTGLDNRSVLNLTTSSVSYKIIHFPLPPLQPIDAAILFTRRIHRPLYQRDWWVDPVEAPPPLFVSANSRESFPEEIGGIDDSTTPIPMNPKHSRGVANLAKLARHPLLVNTHGVPEKILQVAQHVTVELSSINELVGVAVTD